MVRLKIAYWEFDFEVVCPTLDHDLLSQAHIHKHQTQIFKELVPSILPLLKEHIMLGHAGIVNHSI